MKRKFSLICCTLLLAGTLSACAVIDEPQQPVTHNDDELTVTEIAENSNENSDANSNASANSQNAESASETPQGNAGDDASAGDSPAAQEQPAQNSDASADDQSYDNDPYHIGSEPTLSIGIILAKAGQKSVPVTVKLTNNPGYAAAGIRVVYDPAITPQYDPDTWEGVSDAGPAVGDAMSYCSVATENNIVAYGILGQKNCTADGNLFTCYFDMPENATSGTVYKLKTETEAMNDVDSHPVKVKLIGGEIRID